MRTKRKADHKVEELIGQVLGGLQERGARQLEAWKKPGDDIHLLVKADYVRKLRRRLNYRQLKDLVAAFARIFPNFNSRPLGIMSVEACGKIATKLGFHFKAAPYAGEEGLALRGFYVTRAQGMLKQPLMYVNTAHHRLAVMSTFCHELGHHVSSELFGFSEEPIHFFFDADYITHLEEPSELAADVMVSLSGYPAEAARKIFATEWNWGLVARAQNMTDEAFEDVRNHLKKAYGFDLMERLPADRRLHYLLGMIHYSKLRWALLAEYDI
jgi:hypothetical protein